MATVASLVFEMSANIARLQSDMSKAKSTVDTAMSGIKSAVESAKMAMGALGIAASGGAFISFINGAIESEAALKHLAERTGESVEALSALRGIAKGSGTEMDLVASSAQKLSKNMLDVATTGGGKAAPAFAALGIEVKDSNGQLRASQEVMQEVAVKLDAMENRTQAVAYAQLLMGKSGANLLPFLHDLANAGELHAKVTTEQAEAADKFEKQLIKLEAGAKRLGITLANTLLPALNTVLGALLKPNDKVDAPWFDKIFTASTIKINEWMIALEKGTAAAARFVGASKIANMHEGIAGDLQKGIDKLNGQDRDAALAAYRSGERGSYGKAAPSDSGEALDGPNVRSAHASKDKMLNAHEIARHQMEDMEEIAKSQREMGEYQQKEQESREKSAEAVRRMIDPTRQYYEELKQIVDLVNSGSLSPVEGDAAFAKVSADIERVIDKQNATAKAVKQTNDFAKEMGLTFSSAFEAAMVKGKKFSDVLKGLGQDIANIVLRKTVTEPLGNAISGIFDSKSGSGGGGIINFLSGLLPGRASGGPVSSGSAYLVGENGPEVMVPGAGGGTIIPNGAMGGMGGMAIHQSINVGGNVTEADIPRIINAARMGAIKGVQEMQRRGVRA